MANNALSTTSRSDTNIFQSIANTIHHVTSLPVSIWAPDQDRTALRIVAAVGLPANYIQTSCLDLGMPSVTGDAFKKRKIQIAKDIASDPRWYYKERAQEMNWKSAICVPIEAQNVVIGVISVYAYIERSISELVYTLPEFAKQIGLTIEADKQNEVLQRILDTGEKLQSMTESLRDVLNAIVKSACELTGADCAVIYPYDAEHGEFYDIENVASYGLQEPLNLPEKPRAKGGMASYVRRKGHVIITDVEKQTSAVPASSSFIQREGIKAFMGVALKVGDDVLGVLYVNLRVPHEFAQHEKDTIRLFAHQAANALNNARLYQQVSSRIVALEKLHEVGTSLTSIPGAPGDLKDILMRIAQSAKQVLGADLVELYQYVQSRDWYELPLVRVGEHYDKFVTKDTIHKDDVLWEIVRGRRPRYTADAQESKVLTRPFTVSRDDAPKQRFVIREGIKSSAAIPLMVGPEVVGVLFANYRTSQTFSEEKIKLIELFASQAAIAIWNARLFASMQRRLEERLADISAFQQIYDKMYSANQEELMSLIAEKAARLTNSKYGALWLADKDGTQLVCVGAAGDPRPASMLPKLALDKNSINGWVMYTGQPYLSNNIKKDPHYKDWYTDACSELAVPLLYNNKAIGTLDVESTSVDNFTDDHMQLLQTLATQAAIAIQNSRIIKKLDALDDISRALTATIRLQETEILDLIYRDASQLMDTNNMYIALYDARTDMVRFGLAYVDGRKVNPEEEEGWHPRKAGKGRTEEIIRTRKSILISTKQEAKRWYAQPGREEYIGSVLTSWLGVPMIIGDQAIGVIATYHPSQAYVYTIDDLEILQAMANQAAIALDNATLYYDVNQELQQTNKQLERRVQALAAVNDVGNTLTSGIRLQEENILKLIFAQAQKLTGAEDLYIALYDEDTGEIRFAVATENGRPVIYPSRKANHEKRGKTDEIIFTRKPILHKTLKEAEEWYSQFSHAEFIGHMSPSWLGVPMMVGERILGVIAAVDLEKEFAYDELHLEALSSIASQAAIALDNAALYYDVNQKLEGANQQLETILNIISAAELNADLHEFLQNILKDLLGRINAKNGTIQLYDPKRNELIIWAKIGSVINPNYQHISLDIGLTGKAAKEKRAIYVPDVRVSPEYANYMLDTRSEYATPMLIGDTLIGVLNVEDPTPDAISSYHRQLIELLGNQIAILIRQKLIMRSLEEKRLIDQVNESLGLVTAEVAHKVGNAAGKIRFLARERLQDAPNINQSQRKDIQIILRNVEDMIRATDDLFKPFGMEPKVEITVEEMIRVAIGQCATPKNIKISAKFEAGLPKVNVQVTKVQSYLTELLINAVKYTIKGMAGKKVRSEKIEIIGQRSKDGFVEIHFTNHGPAIPSENWESIFRVFSARGEKSDDDQSYGLGLWGARATMQQQGGDVFLLESDDVKTTFVARFPLA